MLISEAYREQNRQLHEARPDYGTSSHKWAQMVDNLCRNRGMADILDYGCGKGLLKEFVTSVPVREYDPAIPGKDKAPEPADLVVCTDVLEHIEPDCLDAVLDDLGRLTRKAAFLVAATRPAHKTLPDGRNAHLIIEDAAWWRERIATRFHVVMKAEIDGGEVLFIAEPKC